MCCGKREDLELLFLYKLLLLLLLLLWMMLLLLWLLLLTLALLTLMNLQHPGFLQRGRFLLHKLLHQELLPFPQTSMTAGLLCLLSTALSTREQYIQLLFLGSFALSALVLQDLYLDHDSPALLFDLVVAAERICAGKRLLAGHVQADIRLGPSVHADMTLQIVLARKNSFAHMAGKRLGRLVCLQVGSQVDGPRKGLVAVWDRAQDGQYWVAAVVVLVGGVVGEARQC